MVTGIELQFFQLLNVWYWTSYLTCLSLRFLTGIEKKGNTFSQDCRDDNLVKSI